MDFVYACPYWSSSVRGGRYMVDKCLYIGNDSTLCMPVRTGAVVFEEVDIGRASGPSGTPSTQHRE